MSGFVEVVAIIGFVATCLLGIIWFARTWSTRYELEEHLREECEPKVRALLITNRARLPKQVQAETEQWLLAREDARREKRS